MNDDNNIKTSKNLPLGGKGAEEANSQRLSIIIAGGGTGGHIFPAVAIANAIKNMRPDADILFVGAKGKMETKDIVFPSTLLMTCYPAGQFLRGFRLITLEGPPGYDLNPKEARERTDEGMELILKAWTEPQPFGWQGRYFQYRTVSIWPQPQEEAHRPTYALGVSAEAADFAARHHLGLGVSYGTFELMAKSTGYYRQRCAEYGWEPGPDDIIYRANMILTESEKEKATRPMV